MKHPGQHSALEEEDTLRRTRCRGSVACPQEGSACSHQAIFEGVCTSQSHCTAAGQLPQLLTKPALAVSKAWSSSVMKASHHPHLSAQPALRTPIPPPHSWAGHPAGGLPCLHRPSGPIPAGFGVSDSVTRHRPSATLHALAK